jgi:hypothetical protein
MSKHDTACTERRTSERRRYLCTCGLSELEVAAAELGGYGSENLEQFRRGDFSCASPEDVEHLKAALGKEAA